MAEFRVDLSGKRFNMLVAKKFVSLRNGQSIWLFKCDCGKDKKIVAHSVISNDTKSCGCLRSRTIPVELRFPKLVNKTKGCWIWKGNLDNGYGRFLMKGRLVPAHRVAVELHSGKKIPNGMFVDHICRNRKCVNPYHLRVVSPTVNALENSIGVAVINKNKTRCIHGHPFDQKNTRTYFTYSRTGKHAHRRCVTCGNLRSKEKRRRKALTRIDAIMKGE